MFFLCPTSGTKHTITPFARSSDINQNAKEVNPVGTWLSADLDSIIYDLMGQLRRATESGWHRTKPDHYRAILAALESALKQRHELSVAPAGAAEKQLVPDCAELHPVEVMMPAVLRWSLLPLLGFVASRGQ
jgi:hypothetical protein